MIRQIIDDSVKSILNEMFTGFEHRVESRMNVMSNSFAYIENILKNSGIATSNIDKEKMTWQTDMKNLSYELMNVRKYDFPTYNSVMRTVYSKMRNVYGIVLEQIRKDYKDKYGLDYSPDVLEAIGDNKNIKNIFESILKGLFPDEYWCCGEKYSEDGVESKSREAMVRELIKPLAEKYDDHSKGYNKTLRIIYSRMDCSWSNLQTRYKKTNGLRAIPQKITIVINNPEVYRKFKKSVRELLDEIN